MLNEEEKSRSSSTSSFNLNNVFYNNEDSNNEKDSKKYIISPMNNSPKIVLFNLLLGLLIATAQSFTETYNNYIKLKSFSYSISFIFCSIIITIIKKSRPVYRFSHFLNSIFFICGFYLYTQVPEYTHTIFLLTAIFVFLFSMFYDRSGQLQCSHFLSCMIILFSFVYFEIFSINQIKQLFFSENRITLYYVIASAGLLTLCFWAQQNLFYLGKDIYNYIQIQAILGIFFYFIIFIIKQEYYQFAHTQIKDIGYMAIDIVSFVLFMIIEPFYLKKCHCTITIMFFYLKYGFLQIENENVKWWEVLLVNFVFLLMSVLFFFKKIIQNNIKPKSNSLKNKSLFEESNPLFNHDSLNQTSLLPLTEDKSDESLSSSSLSGSLDLSNTKSILIYKKKSLDNANKYFL